MGCSTTKAYPQNGTDRPFEREVVGISLWRFNRPVAACLACAGCVDLVAQGCCSRRTRQALGRTRHTQGMPLRVHAGNFSIALELVCGGGCFYESVIKYLSTLLSCSLAQLHKMGSTRKYGTGYEYI